MKEETLEIAMNIYELVATDIIAKKSPLQFKQARLLERLAFNSILAAEIYKKVEGNIILQGSLLEKIIND